MLTDNLFTIHHVNIPVTEINKPIYLIPWGDLHRFASLCSVKKWQEFCEWAKNKPNSYFLGMGDYDDLASASERKILNSCELHDFTKQSLEELGKKRSGDLIAEIEFMRGKLIGLLEGNHHFDFSSGITSTQYMCQQLGCKYLGVSSFIRLSFSYGEKRAKIDIWAHHGKGASRGVGGSLNTVEQMGDLSDADILLMGHDHKKSIALKNRLSLTGGQGLNITEKKILLARTGSFLRGYVTETPSYIAGFAGNPTDLGVVKIELTPKRFTEQEDGDRKDSFYIDVHASI